MEREAPSQESSPALQNAPQADEASAIPPKNPAPSFIQTPDGGLVAGSIVAADVVFGPYKGGIRRAPPRREGEKEEQRKLRGFKFLDAAGQAYVVEVDQGESKHPWWATIKQTMEHSQANVLLFSRDGALYVQTLTQIPKFKELQMIVTMPKDITEDAADDVTRSTPTNGVTPVTTPPPPHPASSSSLIEGPPFKCNFCCIEFRNPSNLDAHRVYYCPGTATKPLPSARRRSATPARSTASSTKNTPSQAEKCPDAPAKKVVAVETVRTFVCQLCQSSFESKSNCESHMLLLHCDETANLCKFCNFISGDRQGLCQHVFSHVKETAEETKKCSGDGNKQLSDPTLKAAKEAPEDAADEKENRYETVVAASMSGNRLHNDGRQSASSPGTRHIVNSPSDGRSHSSANLSSPESSKLSLTKEDRSGSADVVVTESPNVVNSHNLALRLSREPVEEDIMACSQCDFVTSRESILLKHMVHHNNHRKKSHDRIVSVETVVQGPDKRDDVPKQSGTKCHECNIVFMSKKNYAAHKQYYCASRHVDSTSPPASREWDTKSGMVSSDESDTVTVDKVERNATKKSMNDSDKLQEPRSLQGVSPCHLPVDAEKTGSDNNSPRNGSLHRTSKVNITPPAHLVSPTTRSSPDDRPAFDRPLPMIRLDGGRPQFLPPGAVLQGPQLVLVTPIVIPQSISGPEMDSKLNIPVVRAFRGEQPLDLSTKPKTPPLSDLSESETHNVIISAEVPSKNSNVRFLERQSHRCEECEISFSKKESLVVHKQYYCASRHVFTPRGLVRTKQYATPKLPEFLNSQPHSENPSPEYCSERSSSSDRKACYFEIKNSEVKPKISDNSNCSAVFSNSSTVSDDSPSPLVTSHTVSRSPLSEHSATTGTPSLPNGNSTSEKPNFAKTNDRHIFQTLKRVASDEAAESVNERSLPPIKRKRNLISDGNDSIPLTTSTSGQVTNGIIIKQEPKDTDSVINAITCEHNKGNRTLGESTKQTQQPTQNKLRRSSLSQIAHDRNSPVNAQTDLPHAIKQESCDRVVNATNGGFLELPESCHAMNNSHRPSGPLQQAPSMSSVIKPNFSSKPPAIRLPFTSATPLTIPIYRHSSSRHASPARHMTVSSYLNTGTSRPLLRGLKPTVKHCRNCNISFSSLSTFIAHKKYYCASHHQTKNAAT